jgi:hypothetical protein
MGVQWRNLKQTLFTIDLLPAPISKHWMATTEREEFKKQLQECLGEFDRVNLHALFVKKKDLKLIRCSR